MPSTPTPFIAPDLSQLARSLGQALQARHRAGEGPPGHVELLNLLARATGHRNVQALRAAARHPAPALAQAVDDREPISPLTATARKTLLQFDSRGRLVRWPTKFSVQRLAMWVLWTRFDARRVYTEKEVNAILMAANTFDDHVTLRRELINHQLMTRKSDCSEYRKLPARPDDETRSLLRAWREQMHAARAPRERRADAPPRHGASMAAPAAS